ncbi:MAG TPA: hypothetical protein VGV60_05725 [Candidatus Polarisedimenticolia bacterium]|jgi:hypothetical protein|nr:hypothetical protein [Candidatus Polarisedimenticolia bacterium]
MRSEVRWRAAVAALGVLAALACNQKRGAAGLVRSSSLGTFPKETAALLVIEIKKVKKLGSDLPWVQNLASMAESDGGPFKDIVKRFGKDTLSQVDRLSLAVVPASGHRVGYGVLAEGSFDTARMREAIGGQDILPLVEAPGKMDFSISVLPDGSLALGPREVLEVMRGNAASRGHGLDSNELLLKPLERVRTEAQFWGTIDCRRLAEIVRQSTESGDLAGLPLSSKAARSLLSLAFRGTIGDSTEIDLMGQADTEPSAKTLADSARGLIALGRVGAGRDQAKEWLEFLDGIHIAQSGTDVTLRASVPSKTMQTFVGRMVSTEQVSPSPGVDPGGTPRLPGPAKASPPSAPAPAPPVAPAPVPPAAPAPAPPGS